MNGRQLIPNSEMQLLWVIAKLKSTVCLCFLLTENWEESSFSGILVWAYILDIHFNTRPLIEVCSICIVQSCMHTQITLHVEMT